MVAGGLGGVTTMTILQGVKRRTAVGGVGAAGNDDPPSLSPAQRASSGSKGMGERCVGTRERLGQIKTGPE